jgi:hypothetical protein
MRDPLMFLAAVVVAALGSVPSSASEPLPAVRVIAGAPQIFAGDFYVDTGPMHNLLAIRDPNDGRVKLTISIYDQFPTRRLLEVDAQPEALTISDDFQFAHLAVDVAELGFVDIHLQFFGAAPGFESGCLGAATGLLVTALSGRATVGLTNYWGSIAGKVITSSTCHVYAERVDGAVWYSNPLWW